MKSLKLTSWEGSLLDWIDFASTEYFAQETLREYQRWLIDQLDKPGNVVPFRLVSGRAPKGKEFVRRDGTVLYAADNEPLSGLWGLVAEGKGPPREDLGGLLAGKSIPGSWPPKRKPTRFTCRWGPAPLRLKDRGMKIAHLIDAGRNPIPIEPDQLKRRALLTLSLANCFPMPNRACVEFSRGGAATDDLAERPEVQSLLLSFVAEHIGGASYLEPLLAAFGAACPVSLEPEWKRKAAAFLFAVRPKSRWALPDRASAPPAAASRSSDGPRSFGVRKEVYPDLHAALAELKDWLAAHPGVERLDDWPGTAAHGTAYVRFQVDHLAGTDLVIPRPGFPGSKWTAADYTGVFHLNGDTKAMAIRTLVEMAENGLEIEEMIEPDLTATKTINGRLTGENPRFILVGRNDAEGFYCYRR